MSAIERRPEVEAGRPTVEGVYREWARYVLRMLRRLGVREASLRSGCATPGEVCVPAGSLPSGFRACIGHEGDVECPSVGPYQERHVFYGDVDDTRSCTPCACGAPVGSGCEGLISVFEDGACSSLLVAATVTDAESACLDVPAGSPLGSKSAGAITYRPGVCQASGGEPMGSAAPILPATFCCLAGSSVG